MRNTVLRKGAASTRVRLLGLVAGAAVALSLGATSAQAAPCTSTFGGDFIGSYTCNNLGTPTGVTGLLGGVNFLDNNTLLIGGDANGGSGYIAQIGVTRDANNHIIGFSGPSSVYATAPFIDGGLAYGPGDVLFATGYPNNTIMQFLPGSSAPDKTISLPGATSSVGALQFVPAGFAGAGGLKIISYNGGGWFTADLAADGFGTYDITNVTFVNTPGGGPEGMVYVDGANDGFGADSLLISEYGAGKVAAYDIDANGDPILGTRRDFLTGLSGAEGAVIDPLTGDFIFSTFGGQNSVYVVSGFAAPPTGVPEPATWMTMLLGVGLAGSALRTTRRKRALAAV